MGDLASGIFKKWCILNDVRFDEFGFDRPPFDAFALMNPFLRHAPDFICETKTDVFNVGVRHVLVEVKGVGRDQIVKIKVDNVIELVKWQRISKHPYVVFVYDSTKKAVSYSLNAATMEVLLPSLKVEEFVEADGSRKPYYAIPCALLEWEPMPTAETLAADLAIKYESLAEDCNNLVLMMSIIDDDEVAEPVRLMIEAISADLLMIEAHDKHALVDRL